MGYHVARSMTKINLCNLIGWPFAKRIVMRDIFFLQNALHVATWLLNLPASKIFKLSISATHGLEFDHRTTWQITSLCKTPLLYLSKGFDA